jgi:hypothetical protein
MPGRLISRSQAGRTQPTTKALALPAPATSSAAQGATPAAQRLCRLTPAEMAAKREKGECFNCSEKFSRAHLEVCPMKGLFLLELESAEEGEFDNMQPQISLNAITGISAAETMRLQVRLLDTVMDALVDSGSTHSFISLETASRLHLQPDYRPGHDSQWRPSGEHGHLQRYSYIHQQRGVCIGFLRHTIGKIRDGVRSTMAAHLRADLMGFWSRTDELLV